MLSIFTPNIALAQILGYAKLEQNQIILSLSVQKIFFENFDLLWGRYQKEWTDIFYLNTRPWANINIGMCEI